MTAPVHVPPPPVMPRPALARVPARLRRLRGVEADAIVVEVESDGTAMVLRAGGAS